MYKMLAQVATLLLAAGMASAAAIAPRQAISVGAGCCT